MLASALLPVIRFDAVVVFGHPSNGESLRRPIIVSPASRQKSYEHDFDPGGAHGAPFLDLETG